MSKRSAKVGKRWIRSRMHVLEDPPRRRSFDAVDRECRLAWWYEAGDAAQVGLGKATKGVAIVLTGQSRKVLDPNQEISSLRCADTVLVSAVPAESLDGTRAWWSGINDPSRSPRSWCVRMVQAMRCCSMGVWQLRVARSLLWQFSLTSAMSK